MESEIVMVVILFILVLALLGTVISASKDRNSIMEKTTPEVGIAVIILAILCFLSDYFEVIPQGEHRVLTEVERSTEEETETFTMYVDFDISHDGDPEYGYYYILTPKTLYWPEGGYTILEYADYDDLGGIVYAYEDDIEYKIDIPKKDELSFSRIDKLLAISWFNLLFYFGSIILGIVSIILYSVKKNQNGEKGLTYEKSV